MHGFHLIVKQVNLKIFLGTTVLLASIFFSSISKANQREDLHNEAFNFFIKGKKDEAISQMKSIVGSSKDLPDYKLEKERYWIDEAYKFLRKNGVELA